MKEKILKDRNLTRKHSLRLKAYVLALVVMMFASTFLVLLSSDANAQTVTVPGNLLQYEWPMRGADSMLSYSSAGPAPTTYSVLWKTRIPGLTWINTPVAFNGMVFIQGGDGRTYGLDPFTGNIVWNVSGTGALYKLDNTYMMRGTTCVRISDGSTVWTAPAGFSFTYYAADIKMFLSAKTGWNIPDLARPPVLAWNLTDQQYHGVPGSYSLYANRTLFVGTQDAALMALDARTGTTKWITYSTAGFFYSPTYADGKVLFGGLDNNMYAWDANTGKLVWTYNPGTWYGQWASGASTANGLVYWHNQDTYLYAINVTTGHLVWKAKGAGIGYSDFNEVGGGVVFCAMGEAQYRDFETGEYGKSEFNAYNATTGKLLWSAPIETGAGPVPHECIAYGNLYIVPILSTPTEPGEWAYGGAPSGEIWCIGGTQVKDWPVFLGSADNSGQGTGPSEGLALKWEFKADGPLVGSTSLVNGVGYFGTLAGTMYAVDASTGAMKWSHSIGFPIKSTPAVANGRVYTGSDDGNVYALDSSTGTQIWKTSVGGAKNLPFPNISTLNYMADVRSSPKIYQNVLYVGALDGNLYALDLNSGNILWKYQTGGPIVTTPCIEGGAIYISASTTGVNGTLCKLDLSGRLIWKCSIPYFPYAFYDARYFIATPTIATDLGIVFLRNSFRLNYGINATTGAIVWTYDGKFNPAAATSGQYGGVLQLTAPLCQYGKLYINDYYGITCLDARNGTELWHTFLSRENMAQGFAYSHNRLYTVNEIGAIYILDAMTGSKVAYREVGAYQIHSTPSLYNNSLYVGSFDWNLYCFEEAPAAQVAGQAMATVTTVTVTPGSQTLYTQVTFSGTVVAQSTGIPVKVHITAIDPNNNYHDISNATCDESGFFTSKWTPPVPGTYIVTAKFDGDQYFTESFAKTTFTVTEASATPVPLSVNEIVQLVLSGIRIPAGVSADEVAQKVLLSLPANPTADQIAQAISGQLITNQTLKPAEYSTPIVIIIIAVVAALAICVVNLFLIRKRK